MDRTLRLVLLGAVVSGSAGCRSASEGSPAGDVAHVRQEVARRTGAAYGTPMRRLRAEGWPVPLLLPGGLLD